MAAERPGDLPVLDLWTMEGLCQPSLNGWGGPITPIAIQETNFGLKNDMIQQVQNSCQFHGLPGDDANKHLDKFLHVTQSIKVNGVTDDALRLYLFPHSLTYHANCLLRNSINIFEKMAKMFLEKYFPPSIVTKLKMKSPIFVNVNQQVKAVTPSCETYGGPHSFFDCPATVGNTQNDHQVSTKIKTKTIRTKTRIKETIILGGTTKEETNSSRKLTKIPQHQVVTTNEFTNFMKTNDAILKNMQTNKTSLTNSNLELKNMFGQFMKMNTASSLGSGTLTSNTITNPKEDLKGITTRSGTAYPGPTIPTTSSSPIVERKTEATKDMVHPTNNESTKDVQPPVVQSESPILNSEPVISPIIEPVASPVSALKPNQRPSIPYPSRLHDQKLRDKKLYLPDLSPTCMTLELADRSISRPIKVVEDVFVKVGTFYFPADFVVVDFDVDPRVPLILRRPFLKTGRALIDVFEGELTLRVGKEAITFNLDQTSRYSTNYNDMTANRIDVIDMACEEYSQEVLGFSNVIVSGNPTPYYDSIVFITSLTLTLFRNSDFLLEEVDAFLALKDDPTSLEVNQSYVDTEGDILLLEAFLNDDPSLPLPNQGNYLPQVRKELKICEAKSNKSSIDEPLEVELKDLPPHLEYAFLEGDDKLPVIIAKDLSV
nr:reverse transcriptase domain-containing protein [Tanacetum cinerariifolium]